MNGPVVKAFALVYRAGSNFWGASMSPTNVCGTF